MAPLDAMVMLLDSAMMWPHPNLSSIPGVYLKDQQVEDSLIGPLILMQPTDRLPVHLSPIWT